MAEHFCAMLTNSERHQALAGLRYTSNVALLTIQVDVGSWKIHPGAGLLWKRLACPVSFGIFLMYVIHVNGSLVHAFLFQRDTIPLHQLLIHLRLAVKDFLVLLVAHQVPGAECCAGEHDGDGTCHDGRGAFTVN